MTDKFKVQSSKFKVTNVIFVGIILLVIFLRLYNLLSVPPSASLDEASIGWNAYSILKTGGDEYGNKLPILLRAYDDFRPALYVYTVIPFVQVFGLDVLSVRLPSVILSVLSVIAAFFLIKELFKSHSKNSLEIPIIAAALLAISPWHIYISRLGHEANLAFAFGIFAILFFIKFTNTFKNIYVYLSAVFFALSFYAYQAEKIFIPLLVILLAFIFRSELLKRKKHIIFSVVFGIIILAPVLKETLSSEGLTRLRGTSAFDTNQSVYVQAAENRLAAKEDGDLLKELISNNRIISLQIFAKNYISHFNPAWLFTNKSNDDFKAPGVGLLHPWELPLILIGFLFLFSKGIDKKTKAILLAWLIISPVAASISTGAPHAMRSLNMLPVPQILSAIGVVYIWRFLNGVNVSKKRLILLSTFTISFLIIVGSVFYFFKQYYFVFPKEQSDSFQYALHGAVKYVDKNENKYERIVFSNQDNLYQSYMFFLFGSVYDPELYQKEGGTVSGGFAETHAFDKYEFRPINWMDEVKDSNILYVGNVDDFPQNLEIIKTCDYLNGETGVKIVKGA